MKILKLIVNRERNFVYIFLIIFIGLISFTWYKGDLILSGGDAPFNFSPLSTFPYYYSTWSDINSLGGVNTQVLPRIFIQLVYIFFSGLHIPLWFSQRAINYFLFVSGGLGSYLLANHFLQSKKYISLWAAIFYMFNPFSLVFVWGVLSLLPFAYAAFPLLLYIFARGLQERKIKNITLFCIVSIVYSSFYGNFSYVLTFWILLISYLIFNIFSERKDRLKKIFFSSLLVIFWFSTNAYWLFPYFASLKSLVSVAAYQDSVEILRGVTAKAGLQNSFRLFGNPVFFEKFMNVDLFFRYSSTYKTPIFILISFISPILVFLSFLNFNSYTKKSLRYFALLLLITIFFYKGSRPPFGEILETLVKKFPLMSTFRNPLDKTGPLLAISFSMVIAAFFSQIEFWLKERKNHIFFIIIFLSLVLFGIFSFPFWSGKVFQEKGKVRFSVQTKIPDYYFKLSEYLKRDKENYRIFPVPINNAFGVPYEWEYGHGGADPLNFVLPKPLVYMDSKLVEVAWHCLIENSSSISEESDSGCLASILSRLNVKYILVHYDIKEKYFNVDPIELELERKRFKSGFYKGIEYDKTFGEIELYKINNAIFLNRFYFPKEISYLRSSSDDFFKVLMNKTPGQSFFINRQNNDNDNEIIFRYVCEEKPCIKSEITVNNQPDKTIEIFTRKIFDEGQNIYIEKDGPVNFKLTIDSILLPQFLTFSERYDSQWEAFQNGKKLKHLLINYYANGWLIEPGKNLGEKIIIKIKYKPQIYFIYGLLFTIFSYTILFISFILNIIRDRIMVTSNRHLININNKK